jgi:hypothetical protein
MTHAIQKFMTQGCPGEIIRFAVRKEIRRIGRVPERFGWFENPIKWAYQNHLRTPNLEIIDGGLSHQPRGNGGYGRSQNAGRYTVNDAARDLYQRTLAAYEAQCARDGTGDGAPRLLPAV